MSWLQLTPQAATGGVSGASRSVPGLATAVIAGGIGFMLVSVAAYSIWAFRLVPGEAAMYAAITVVYLGLGGVALSWLVAVPGAVTRFPPVFALGFLIYAIGWCAFWFGLRGKHYADLWGALVGLAGLTWLWQRAFGVRTGFAWILAGLFALHSVGYYVGGELHAQFRGSTGRLLWGAAHGLGFGAGLGWALHHLQIRASGRSNQP
jgi:hypothetical protein